MEWNIQVFPGMQGFWFKVSLTHPSSDYIPAQWHEAPLLGEALFKTSCSWECLKTEVSAVFCTDNCSLIALQANQRTAKERLDWNDYIMMLF